MKKVVLSLALVAMMSVSFVSCKETAKEETVTEEVAPVAEEAVEATTEVVDSAAAPAADAAATEAAPATDAAAAPAKEEVKK
ncbi:hypothetical protein FCR2A7T_15170 [Flavobacterium cauense R2A-7]|uniref:Lipoprotein n=1 Tax=Flavobacterium cauense R2A-7 TaxID=1341154 RepID=V6S1F5_9FLAO|nr:hypothetical protein [Flavobacterium cauense]ESU20107.1 hypothetical protein FCR2A7T_15170 [Flavobacterium cauense R2A-7]KGO83909.1 hypothetical protein Q762_01290 [Flavobacterium cauense R2A-7]TWI14754.1 hypothetical protein IP98_00729 [Flavobacterium cauense R2A-7]